MSSDASLTNIEMVKPRGPRVFLAVLALAAVGGAAWWLTRPAGPVGEPEDPRKLLVVGQDADVADTLRELGFVAEHGTFDALAAEGAQQGARGSGVEAILHLADLRGIGYVAIENPASHPLDGLTVTGDSQQVAARHRWAVFSVGELGMPPKVTVDAEASELPLPPYIELLRAAFAQNRLANTLFAESQLPMDAVEVHRQIKPAVDLYAAYAVLDKRVAKDLRKRTEVLVDAEEATPKPAVLARALEDTKVLPLGDGTLLSFVHAWRLESPRDTEVALQPATEVELWFHAPGTVDVSSRQRCGALRSGTLALGGTDVVTSPAADALLLESESGLELWTLDGKAGACAFTRKGAVPRPLDGEYTWGVPHATGKVLRPAMPLGALTVNVWTTGTDRPQEVAIPGCNQMDDPVWLDAEHFAIACAWAPPVTDEQYDEYQADDEAFEPPLPAPTLAPAQAWIYVVRIADGKVVAIPGTVLGEHTGIYTLHAVPGARGLELLALHPWGGKLSRLRGEKDHRQLFAEAEATFAMLGELDAKAAADAAKAMEERLAAAAKGRPAPEPAPPAVEAEPAPLLRPAFVPAGGMVAALAGAGFSASTIDTGGEPADLAISPDGTRIVFTADLGHEVRVMKLEGGTSTTIAKTPAATHQQPRFTADGKAVAFTSSFDGNERSEQVGQVAVLGE